ncbi:dihydrodipicolinate synthase family protein [Georgenia sp. AZ-5]|uniref:dihydrodipicolinate synthase family protein n=1 Tax=Georgenia sp. AZ-5 TaxID=3367526 RepID=UPI003754BED5
MDTGALRALVRPIVDAGVDSVGLLGSTGSYPYLSRAERRRAVDAARAEAGETPLVVGVGALRTDDAVDLARDARDAGASAVLLAPVSYIPLTDDEVVEHFAAVAAAGVPVCVYNNPSTTGRVVTPGLLARLARLPGVVGVKNPGSPAKEVAAELGRLRGVVPAGFSCGYSGDWHAAGALLAGADAWYSVLAGSLPEVCVQLHAAARSGDVTAVAALDARLGPVWELFRELSSYRVVHAVARLRGVAPADPPRPVLPLGDAARARVGAVLRDAGLL